MEESQKVYFCKVCRKNDSETKFYEYLNTRCMECKRKSVKDSRNNKIEKIRDEKINEVDPDEKIRFLWSEMMREPFMRNGRKSIMDFIEETEQDISDLVIEDGKIRNDFFKSLDLLKEQIQNLNKFQRQIDEIIDIKVENKIKEIMKSYNK